MPGRDKRRRLGRRYSSGGLRLLRHTPSAPERHRCGLAGFGGYGASGLGRERGIQGFLEFLQFKAISPPHPDQAAASVDLTPEQ
jgi:acyl-CoA reductase-like NAD-dependent aldehyde dehydrogenase